MMEGSTLGCTPHTAPARPWIIIENWIKKLREQQLRNINKKEGKKVH